jgi:hypothetical protein
MMSRGHWLRATTLMPRARVCRATPGPTSRRKAVHHVEGRLAAIEKEALETGAAAGLDIGDAGLNTGLDGGHKVIGQYPGTENGLKAVTKRRVHELNNFFTHRFSPSLCCGIME